MSSIISRGNMTRRGVFSTIAGFIAGVFGVKQVIASDQNLSEKEIKFGLELAKAHDLLEPIPKFEFRQLSIKIQIPSKAVNVDKTNELMLKYIKNSNKATLMGVDNK